MPQALTIVFAWPNGDDVRRNPGEKPDVLVEVCLEHRTRPIAYQGKLDAHFLDLLDERSWLRIAPAVKELLTALDVCTLMPAPGFGPFDVD